MHTVIQKFSSETCPEDFMQKVNFAYVLRYIYLYIHLNIPFSRESKDDIEFEFDRPYCWVFQATFVQNITADVTVVYHYFLTSLNTKCSFSF